jgi:hypothetical protein
MYEVIILFIILFLIFNKKHNNNDTPDTPDTPDIPNIPDIPDTPDNEPDKEIIILTRGDTPALRGYIDFYNKDTIKEEGGSKVFNHIIKDNNNLKANQVNYKKYESYRKKPFTLEKTIKRL